MTDVRALLAAERQSRRITHPDLTYTKKGSLVCNICNLNVKSEQLWPGHLKSLNHRKNVQQTSQLTTRPQKRKIDSTESEGEQERSYVVDTRKKPKSEHQSQDRVPAQPEPEITPGPEPPAPAGGISVSVPVEQRPPQASKPLVAADPAIDEDEWAAFERDVAEVEKPDYSGATIEAAPVSAAELTAQQKANAVQLREDEAEAEGQDESRRMEEEFEVMEEMEDRVQRLRARREALRPKDSTTEAKPALEADPSVESIVLQQHPDQAEDADSSDDDADDWYR